MSREWVSEDAARFESAPCFLCGYNGRGYYQPSIHPCSLEYHRYRVTVTLAPTETEAVNNNAPSASGRRGAGGDRVK